jgi:hypothetical protein
MAFPKSPINQESSYFSTHLETIIASRPTTHPCPEASPIRRMLESTQIVCSQRSMSFLRQKSPRRSTSFNRMSDAKGWIVTVPNGVGWLTSGQVTCQT